MSHGSHQNWSLLVFVKRYITIQTLQCSSRCLDKPGRIALPEATVKIYRTASPIMLAFSQVPHLLLDGTYNFTQSIREWQQTLPWQEG